jgi:hypothetical protein
VGVKNPHLNSFKDDMSYILIYLTFKEYISARKLSHPRTPAPPHQELYNLNTPAPRTPELK